MWVLCLHTGEEPLTGKVGWNGKALHPSIAENQLINILKYLGLHKGSSMGRIFSI
jgi:hypothetical protein